MQLNTTLNLFVLLSLLYILRADQFVYTDTNAEDIVDENLSQTPLPDVHLSVLTSNAYHSGSTDQISLVFVGEFSVSGPHAIGPFETGGKDLVTVQLDRKIGQLKEVVLHKEGVDSYLLSELECRIGNQVYVMKGPRQWLDNLDPLTEASYEESKGYEPLAQEELHDLPAATALTLTVDNVFYYYVETGMFTS